MNKRDWMAVLMMTTAFAGVAAAEEKIRPGAAPDHPGYRLLINKPYLPPEFDRDVFDSLWRTWESPLRRQAAGASAQLRRKLAFSRYGLTPRPGEENGWPLQYVDAGGGGWTINCFACHGGKVAGRVIPGLPNSHFAMQTLNDEMRAIKLVQGKLTKRDLAGSLFPLGKSNGTTNAVMFGVAVLAVRDDDLNVDRGASIPDFVHHDMDAPPWWNVKKKKWLYADGSTENDHRALMPFLLSSGRNSGEKVRGWEDDFKQIYQWILSIEPPKYPFAVDRELAAAGRTAFNRSCARCHGTYGEDGEYPNKIVPIDVVGTDPVRLEAIKPQQHEKYGRSWFSHYGKKKINARPGGYLAPPLDGIWASAPYFHNGAVPTLWHVLHPARRPRVWIRSEDGYDRAKVGLQITAFDAVPAEAKSPQQRRRYFDTRLFGKSRAGHRFPNELSEQEKRAVLEYLKTL